MNTRSKWRSLAVNMLICATFLFAYKMWWFAVALVAVAELALIAAIGREKRDAATDNKN